jgi:hypothetical protein
MVAGRAMNSDVRRPFLIGTFGLVGPSVAVFAGTGLVGAIALALATLCIWSAVLGWAWYEHGIWAFIKFLPSLLLLLPWPMIGLLIVMTCGNDGCS